VSPGDHSPGRISARLLLLGLLWFVCAEALSQGGPTQKTLLLEKIGTNRKFYFRLEDKFQLRTYKPDTMLRGRLWDIGEKSIVLQTYVPLTIQYDNIHYIYKNYKFARKFGIYCMIFSGVTFGVITINHLINNEQVFTPDMAYLTLPFLGAGIISLSLSREKFKPGLKWKLKVLDMPVFPANGF